MYLSRLRLHPRDPLVLRDLTDVTGLHRTVMRAFPQHEGPSPRAHFGVLFRAEPEVAPGQAPVVLVQSTTQPDWTDLPEGYLLEVALKETSGLLDGVVEGSRLRFRLAANPTKKVPAVAADGSPRRHSPRVPLLGELERTAWLVRKSEQYGFAVEPQAVRSSLLPPSGGRGSTAIRVQPVLFEGELRVVDQTLFRAGVEGGIGPAKAYGCGLLSLASAGA